MDAGVPRVVLATGCETPLEFSMIRKLKVTPVVITLAEYEATLLRLSQLEAHKQRALARSHPVLKPGSTAEFVYRQAIDLIQGGPTAAFPEIGNGAARMPELVVVLMPLMPRPQDRNETRVGHYLVYLHMHGLLEIDEGERLVTLPREEQQ
ncbi:MAG: hypothetical protein KF871_04835 [Hydrogenophaga sp.]|uniref:hypothetical protein n=1 Tax=Hydrogenophaga sp. TaxID=1904254 RepID=UPI001DC29064|nr:hypothetical protein [Hydrogenophaga sp.]MBX3609200.1 hypothetical protein [Hydrogenophaga sp.]